MEQASVTEMKLSQEPAYRVPFWVRFRRLFIRPLLRLLFGLFSRVKVSGLEHVPQGQGYVVAYNHVSIMEPPFLLGYLPQPPEALAGADVYHRPGQGLMVRLYGAIPVFRDRYDRQVFDKVKVILRAGLPLMIAPEGTRSHSGVLQRARPGIAYIINHAAVPVVPVAVLGGSDDFLRRVLRLQRPKIELRIGPSFLLPAVKGRGQERRAARQHNADLVMLHIAKLLPPERRGIYANWEAAAA